MAAEAATAAAEAAAAARHCDLRRPGRCHAAGDGTAAAEDPIAAAMAGWRRRKRRRRRRRQRRRRKHGAVTCGGRGPAVVPPATAWPPPSLRRRRRASAAAAAVGAAPRPWLPTPESFYDSFACCPRCHLSVAPISISTRSLYPDRRSLQNRLLLSAQCATAHSERALADESAWWKLR